jgi:uncharacterized protein (DUF1778 family)
MNTTALPRKPLGVRVTADQHRVIAAAASRANRSVSSFVLQAALEAAQATERKRTHEEVLASIERAQALMRKHRHPGESLVDEAIAQSRSAAADE